MEIDVAGNRKNEAEKTLSVCMLASGSKGNSIYISDGHTSILLDVGLSGVEIERRLKIAGYCPNCINAILVSHEHSDHIKGVGILSRRYKLPVYMSRETQKVSQHIVGNPAGNHFIPVWKYLSDQHTYSAPFFTVS
jgi:phosphoribosyl 1,2-cyclic phosphodiesterase